MYRVPLTQGKYATVDDADRHLVAPYKWHAVQDNGTWYAKRKKNGKLVYMHRELLGVTDPTVRIDHRDRDGLNNSRSNLRHTNHSQNALNAVRPTGKDSKYIGVRRSGKRWCARASWDGVRWNCGTYDTEEQAAHAYDDFQRKYNPGVARLNFP